MTLKINHLKISLIFCLSMFYSFSAIFGQNDVTPPTVVCADTVTTSVEVIGNEAFIYASKIAKESFDNQTPKEKLKFSWKVVWGWCGVPDPFPSDAFPISCVSPDFYLNGMLVTVEDEAGLEAYKHVVIKIIDPSGTAKICPEPYIQTLEITTINNKPLTNFSYSLAEYLGEKPLINKGGNTLKFSTYNTIQSDSFQVLLEKNTAPLNGITTFDLVLIQKHILGVQPITDPWLKIAADINNNGKITSADIVELRKMVLGIQENFNNNLSWRFFDAETGRETIKLIIQPNKNNPPRNIIAVKIGDINGNANPK